jgi:hypothetical protein
MSVDMPGSSAPGDVLGDSVKICRAVVDLGAIDDVLRLLHVDLLTRGADAVRLGEWLWAAHWFPHLRHDPLILALADGLPDAWRGGERCDPQILLQFPHTGPEPEVTFHLDREPEWAVDRRYVRIVGIPLSPWRAENGGLCVSSDGGPGGRPVPVELDPGDVVMLAPDAWHSGGINRSGTIRYGVYLRWLASAEAAPASSTAASSD